MGKVAAHPAYRPWYLSLSPFCSLSSSSSLLSSLSSSPSSLVSLLFSICPSYPLHPPVPLFKRLQYIIPCEVAPAAWRSSPRSFVPHPSRATSPQTVVPAHSH